MLTYLPHASQLPLACVERTHSRRVCFGGFEATSGVSTTLSRARPRASCRLCPFLQESLRNTYKEVIQGKKMEQNIFLESGDQIIVP